MKIVLACVLCLAGTAFAQSPPPPACATPEFRQFDFWLGSWTVRKPGGAVVGRSEISRASGSCALREEWTSTRGQQGTSLNFYDPQTTRWEQHWVGDGTILHLHGGISDGVMVLADSQNRIAWTPLADGRVKQEWTTTADGGQTWRTSFVGIYERPELPRNLQR